MLRSQLHSWSPLSSNSGLQLWCPSVRCPARHLCSQFYLCLPFNSLSSLPSLHLPTDQCFQVLQVSTPINLFLEASLRTPAPHTPSKWVVLLPFVPVRCVELWCCIIISLPLQCKPDVFSSLTSNTPKLLCALDLHSESICWVNEWIDISRTSNSDKCFCHKYILGIWII